MVNNKSKPSRIACIQKYVSLINKIMQPTHIIIFLFGICFVYIIQKVNETLDL